MARARTIAITAALAGVLTGVLTGCADTPAPPSIAAPTTTAAPTYQIPPRTARPGETPLPPVPYTDGDTRFELVGLTTGLRSVLGSHAEWPAKGQFVRIRLAVTNTGRNSVQLAASRQLLITADGAEHTPDTQAMLIRRQPEQVPVGSGDRVEFDLIYDIPVDGTPVTLRAFGGPTLADFGDTVGVDIPIGPRPAPPPPPAPAPTGR
jgi:hypothetical protein